MNERNLQDRTRLAISGLKITKLFRNNVGMATLKNGKKIKFGLCTGSSDLIGWTTKRITLDMIGKDVAVFTAIEVKTGKGKVSEKQRNFLLQIIKDGGLAGVARSEEKAKEIIKG